MDFQINPGIVFRTNDFEQGADGPSGLALSANDVTHVCWVKMKSNQYSHLVDRSFCLDVVWVGHDGFNQKFNEVLISVLSCHRFYNTSRRKKFRNELLSLQPVLPTFQLRARSPLIFLKGNFVENLWGLLKNSLVPVPVLAPHLSGINLEL
jgi:hypothetical protein